MRVESVFSRLVGLVVERLGFDALSFNSGCSEAEISRLREAAEGGIPPDLAALLRCANGQAEDPALVFPPDQVSFLSVDRIVSLWGEQLAYRDDEFIDEVECGGRIRSVFFHPLRIPIAQNEMGNACVWVDQIPGPQGRCGQLIFNVDEVNFMVLENSVTDLLASYLWSLECGTVQVERKASDGDEEEYWFTADGRYVDFDVYRELIAR